MQHEGAACLRADEADLRALKPGDELGRQLIAFISQLPEDRRRMIYIPDSFQRPPMFSSPRILKSTDHTLDRSTEMWVWVNFNDRAWMMTAEVRGVRPTELYEPSDRGTTSLIKLTSSRREMPSLCTFFLPGPSWISESKSSRKRECRITSKK
jgi:hypothetical protein